MHKIIPYSLHLNLMELLVLMARHTDFTYMKVNIQIRTILSSISKEEDIVEREIFLQHYNLVIKDQMGN